MSPDWLPKDLGVVALVSVGSLLAVWVPLWRAACLCLRARRATRRVPEESLARGLREGPTRGDPLSLLGLRVLDRSLQDQARETGSGGESPALPADFVVDATRRYVENEYDSRYARLISMYANLLPPIGFVGTTGGMLVLFVSMHLGDASLELGALALALTSSIFALVGFAGLEAMKIRLYGRLLVCLEPLCEVALRAPAPATPHGAGASASRLALSGRRGGTR